MRLFKEQDTLQGLLKEYGIGGFILEPRLKNSIEFAQFHKASLNTVRVVSLRLDDRTEIPFAFARFGQGGKNVDNGRAGGIISVVDIESGVVIAAKDENRTSYIMHPDSGKQIVGFRIPHWEEAKKLAKELAKVVPTTRYTGWDLALTDDGWVLVEGNARGQFLSQIPTKEGIRERFDMYITETNK